MPVPGMPDPNNPLSVNPDNPNYFAPPGSAPAPTDDGGGGDGPGMPKWLLDLLGGGGGAGGPLGLGLSSLLPALISGAHGLYNADKYGEVAKDAANRASPVDLETRKRYQGRLDQLYTDPTAFLEGNPEYMATRKMGAAALGAQNAARGRIGDGGATTDELTFISDLGSRFINQERDDLMSMSGFQFDPANGANMLMKGNDQEIQARTAALGALAYPFGAGQGPGRGGGGGPGGGRPGGSSSDLLNRVSKLPLSSLSPDLFRTLGMIQNGVRGLFNVDPSTLQSLERLGITPDGQGGFSVRDFGTGGAVDDPYGTLGDPYGLGGAPYAPSGTDFGGEIGSPPVNEDMEWTSWSEEQWNDYYAGYLEDIYHPDFDFSAIYGGEGE